MSKIIRLPGVTKEHIEAARSKEDDIDDGVIGLLEVYLALAKKGELRAVAIAGVTSDHVASSAWTGADSASFHEISSSITALYARWMRFVSEDDARSPDGPLAS